MTARDKMELDHVKGIGNFLSTYYTDLVYIRNFQRYKQGKFPKPDYLKKGSGTFYQFLIEFRIMRNVDKTKVSELLAETLWWVNGSTPDSVDGFASHLKSTHITHDKLPTSLASKILFLNNPWKIMPYDRQAKKTLGYKGNDYKAFLGFVEQFGREQDQIATSSFKVTAPYIVLIERQFGREVRNIDQIRMNRFVDKLLWTGEEQSDED